MILKHLALIGVVLGAGLGTAACNDGYGYGGLDVGYGAGGYYGDGYGYGGDYGYGYGAYGPSYFGWYGDYYYPGTGIYVYDRYRRPYRWNDGQRHYWETRRNGWRGDRNFHNDWNGFGRDRGGDNRGYQGYRGNGAAPGYYRNRDASRADRRSGGQGSDPASGRTNGYRGYRGGNHSFGNRGATSTPGAASQNAAPQQPAASPGGGYRGFGGGRGNGGRGGGHRR